MLPMWGKKSPFITQENKTEKQKDFRLDSETFTKNHSKWKAQSCDKKHSPGLNGLSLNISSDTY